jgi:hypothetical protein
MASEFAPPARQRIDPRIGREPVREPGFDGSIAALSTIAGLAETETPGGAYNRGGQRLAALLRKSSEARAGSFISLYRRPV